MNDEIKNDDVVATPAGDNDATTPVVPADGAVSTDEVVADVDADAATEEVKEDGADEATEVATDAAPEAPAAE